MTDIPNVHEFITDARRVLAKLHGPVSGPYHTGINYDRIPATIPNDDPGVVGFMKRTSSRMVAVTGQKILCNVEAVCTVIRYLGIEVSFCEF